MLDDLLKRQSSLLDDIIEKQGALHDAVMKKNWHACQDSLLALDKLQEKFIVLDNCRLEMVKSRTRPQDDEEIALCKEVHSKLVKSKIQNDALNAYLATVTDFMKEMLDRVLPQRTNKIYGYDGQFVKAKSASLVLDAMC